ncbi:MAG: hypothetical protein ACPGEG_10235 [Salibacteraceae bacterium]
MKIITTLILLAALVVPQDFSSLKLLKEIEGEFDYLRSDNFGKLYLVKNDEAFLYDKSGIFLSQNSIKQYGNITDLDVTNGLEISAFFEDQIQVLFLDNQLSLKGREIPLDEMDFPQISNVCSSHGNGIWLYDQVKMELTRLDKNNKHIGTSGNLQQLLGYSPNPIYMREVNNWLYLNDPKRGILVFDMFGTYYKTIPILNIDEFQVKEKKVIYFSNPYLIKFDMTELEYDTSMKIEGNPKQVLVNKNQLNILYNNKLSIFGYTP